MQGEVSCVWDNSYLPEPMHIFSTRFVLQSMPAQRLADGGCRKLCDQSKSMIEIVWYVCGFAVAVAV